MLVLILCAVAVAVATLLAAGAWVATVVQRPRIEADRLDALDRLVDRIAGEIGARAAQLGIQILEQGLATRDHVSAEMARRRRATPPPAVAVPEVTAHPAALPEGVTALQKR